MALVPAPHGDYIYKELAGNKERLDLLNEDVVIWKTLTGIVSNNTQDIKKNVDTSLESLDGLRKATDDAAESLEETMQFNLACSEETLEKAGEMHEEIGWIWERVAEIKPENEDRDADTAEWRDEVRDWISRLDSKIDLISTAPAIDVEPLQEKTYRHVTTLYADHFNRQATFHNSCIRSARDHITPLCSLVRTTLNLELAEIAIPPATVLPRQLRAYWLMLSTLCLRSAQWCPD